MPIQIKNPQYPGLEEWVDDNGIRLVGVHLPSEECEEHGCALHNPSDHQYRDYPLVWDAAERIFVRVVDADEGEYYTDPDEAAYRERNPW